MKKITRVALLAFLTAIAVFLFPVGHRARALITVEAYEQIQAEKAKQAAAEKAAQKTVKPKLKSKSSQPSKSSKPATLQKKKAASQ